MRVPRLAARPGDVLELDRGLEAAAGGELADLGAVDLLPRRLVLELGRPPGGAPRLQLAGREHDVDRALVEIDANLVAGAQQREAAAHRRLGRGVEDRRARRGAA